MPGRGSDPVTVSTAGSPRSYRRSVRTTTNKPVRVVRVELTELIAPRTLRLCILVDISFLVAV